MHIPFSQLIDYAADHLSESPARQQLTEHVQQCDECRQLLAIALKLNYRSSATAATATGGAEPPAHLVQRVLKATRQRLQATYKRQLPATLLHDSKLVAIAPGVRGGSSERELLFAFGHLDLHLSILRVDETESYTLLGQLMASEKSGSEVEGSQIDLLQDAVVQRTVLTDAQGCFRISRLAKGHYGLQITMEHIETVVDPFLLDA